jgi:uncharacterized protein (TIGR02466 family)
MTSILSLFPVKVYKSTYLDTATLKTNLFPKLDSVFNSSEKNNNVFMKDGTICSYHEGGFLHKEFPIETKDIIDFVEAEAKKYWKELNYSEELVPYVNQMWANSTPRGGWVQSHLHGNMPFTGVLYVDASPEQGNIFLENPLEMVLMSQPVRSDIKYPIGEEISVETGDFIIFPGYLRHSVLANTTDRNRLVLAFNFACKGKYWAEQWVKHD